MPQIVVIGGGFGGLAAVRALRRAPVAISLIDRTNHHVFQPLLYQVATAGLSPADIAAPIRSIVSRQKNVQVRMGEVTGIDVAARRVQIGDRSEPYDFLVLAPGASHSYFGKPQWEEFAPGLKTITDATRLRRDILLAFELAENEPDPAVRQALLTFVLVGAGPTGVEMAGAIAELAHRALAADFRAINPHQTRIVLLEAAPRILNSFDDKLAARAHSALTRMGVDVRCGKPVEAIDESGVVVGGERIASRTVIWTAGVMASALTKSLGAPLDRAGRVLVQPDLSVEGHPEIFVIGDASAVTQDGRPLPGVAPVAMQQGRYVGDVIARRIAGRPSRPSFHYVDKGNMATVGRSFAIMDLRGLRLSGFIAWSLWLWIHIFFLIGFRNRLLVMLQWAWAYITFDRGARLITGEKQD